jgi:hypothetical protein
MLAGYTNHGAVVPDSDWDLGAGGMGANAFDQGFFCERHGEHTIAEQAL